MSSLTVRRPLAVLAVLGMVAALLFAVTSTAGAGDPVPTPDTLASFSACPENAGIPDAGFTDIPAGSFFDDPVNCLAYYNVTTGVTPTMYEPGAEVTRSQMALFLARGAAAAGVVLDPTPPDAGFTDIGGLSTEAQTAINALADAGIVKGKTATTYEPGAPVWRQHMALFLTRFLGEAITGPGGVSLGDAATTGAPFTDIGGTTAEANVAINQAWDLGIATGTTATTYDPLGNVNRGQMSLFLTRMYAHANTRPAGVNIQADPMIVEDAYVPAVMPPYDVTYSVTVRNTDFSAAPNIHVDAFRFDAENATDTPFYTDGTCDLAKIEKINPGDTNKCTLTLTDGVSDVNGNFAAEVYEGVWITDGFWINDPFVNLYAWTGSLGATFDADTTEYSLVTVEGLPTPEPPAYVAKGLAVNGVPIEPCPCGIIVHSGDAVTWTAQLMTDGADGIPHNDDDVPAPLADVDVTFAEQWNDGSSSGTSTTVVKTDASGEAAYTKTQTLAVAAPDFARTVSSSTVLYGGTGTSTAVWSLAASTATTLQLTTPTDYKLMEADGSTPNEATATVYDQYGDPYLGVGQVKFWSNSIDGIGTTGVTLNLVGGAVTLPYSWTGDAILEVIDAKVLANAGPPANPEINTGDVDFYWATAGVVDIDYTATQPVKAVDVASMAVVTWRTEPIPDGFVIHTWKADDRFIVGIQSVTLAEFETAIAKSGAKYSVDYLDSTDGNKSSWVVTP